MRRRWKPAANLPQIVRRWNRDDKIRACVHVCDLSAVRPWKEPFSLFHWITVCVCNLLRFFSLAAVFVCLVFCGLFFSWCDWQLYCERMLYLPSQRMFYFESQAKIFRYYAYRATFCLCNSICLNFIDVNAFRNAGWTQTIDNRTTTYPEIKVKHPNTSRNGEARSAKTFDCCIIYSAEILIRFVTHCLQFVPLISPFLTWLHETPQ